MQYRIAGLSVPVSETDQKGRIKEKVIKKIKNKAKIDSLLIVKRSIDARKKNNVLYVYTVDIQTAVPIKNHNKYGLTVAERYQYQEVKSGTEKINHRPVICGFGPAGIFAALILAQRGYRPVVIERGKKIAERSKDVNAFWKNGALNPESNVQFGEGGAGTFSDGKLTTQIKNPRIKKVLETFADFGAPEEVLYDSKPHIGTDVLRNVITNIRKKIEELGGEFHFESKMETINISSDGSISGITVNGREHPVEVLILAPGNSARDVFEMLARKKIAIEKKPFAAGLRIEHLQKDVNASQYGDFAKFLGAADYKLSFHGINKTLYTFCMCPGGIVINAASEPDTVVTNGMSYHSRAGTNANSAILVNINPEDLPEDVLSGMKWQRSIEQMAFAIGGNNYSAPVQLVSDFLSRKKTNCLGKVKPSFTPDITFVDFNQHLPGFMLEALHQGLHDFAKKMPAFKDGDAVLTGIETRSSCPIRILRKDGESPVLKGLFPAGEGAGYAGGIVSAAVDGITAAEEVIKRYY